MRVQVASTVELVVGGSWWRVSHEDGFAALERNRLLLLDGRIETVALPLVEHPGAVLHLMLGLGPLALIETTGPEGHPSDEDGVGAQDPQPAVEEMFPDFDAYR